MKKKQNKTQHSYLVSLFARGRLEGVTVAFTLLELLLVIAVIAILAGIILFALNPAQRLEDANSAQTMAKSDDIRKAIEAYAIVNGGSMPTNIASLTTYGLHDICKAGQSTNCLNLDQLVTDGYLGSIPEDKDGSTTVISGYKLEYNPTKNNVQVYNTDNFADYVDDGATLTTGLVGYWKMDENTGTTATDASGNGNTGTLTNGPTWTFGRYASAVNFDGVNDNIDISPDYFPNYSDFTVSAWILLDPSTYSTSDYFPIFGNNQNNPFLGFNPVNNTIVHFRQHTTSSQTLLWGSITMLEDTNWHHISLTVDQNRLQAKLYIDGLFISSQTIGNEGYTHANGSLKAFGKDYAGYWKGSLDELRIYSRALYTEEISALYNYAPLAVAHWKFDEGSGIVATDSSGNSNTLNLTSLTWGSGRYNSSVLFSPASSTASISDNSTISVNNNGTLTAWINSNRQYPSDSGTTIYRNIVNKWGSGACAGADEGYLLYWLGTNSSGTLRGMLCNGTTNQAISYSTTFQTGRWYHTAFVWDGAVMKLYLDGNEVSSLNQTILNQDDSSVLRIGDGFGGGNPNYRWDGYLDEIRIYNYAMTQTQIQKVMNNEI